ncbi:acyltransferase family protein [Pseudoalteromonas sp. PPB1]|uniref:acyltransferase family protein n=1 Tax=Pseudoalteromonas sp. PPB1 TaxID=2756136 RepID=UPI001890F211|nr:acyltransferase [Pseudoalteromonas sp. PPB1]
MNKSRYSELDWLRVLLIFAVFLHHVFMPFNGDGWHVMNRESSKALDDIMVYFEQVRLHTLFFIAGAGSILLLNKVSAGTFLITKLHRLLIPLIFAMMIVVPPQNYFENITEYHSLADAYRSLMFTFNANHLWFIEFLFVFMLLAVPVNLALGASPGRALLSVLERITAHKHGLMLLGLVIIGVRLCLKTVMPSQDPSLFNLSVSLFFLLFFLAGMCFIKSPGIWLALEHNRATNFKWLLFSSVTFYVWYYRPDISDYTSVEMRWHLWWLISALVSWSGLLTLVGYASAWCKKTPNWLHRTNELIYPFYIVHQTVIVALAFYIVQWDAGIAVKSLSLLFSSLIICAAICYFVIRPFNLTRYLFGLKTTQSKVPESARLSEEK